MFKASLYRDIHCGHGIMNILGTKMQIYLYIIDKLLIDTGPSHLKESIDFFNANNINQVAVTHIHEDHSGLAFWLQKNKQIPIYLSNISFDSAGITPRLPLYRTLIWGKRLAFTPAAYLDKIYTDKYTFDIIPTPGHAKDHITLFEKNEGWLFTGDLFLGTRPVVCLKEENIPQTIASLQKLCQLDFNTMFCAHSGIHHEKAKEKLRKKLEYFLQIKHKTEELYNKGLTLQEIDKKLFPKKPLVTYISSGEWSSYNIINSIINDK